MNLWQRYLSNVFMTLSSSSVTVRRELLTYNYNILVLIEDKIDAIVQRALELTITWLEACFNKQKKFEMLMVVAVPGFGSISSSLSLDLMKQGSSGRGSATLVEPCYSFSGEQEGKEFIPITTNDPNLNQGQSTGFIENTKPKGDDKGSAGAGDKLKPLKTYQTEPLEERGSGLKLAQSGDWCATVNALMGRFIFWGLWRSWLRTPHEDGCYGGGTAAAVQQQRTEEDSVS
ncbi:hypothetical protein PPACK8108_LOCUS10782 [Phakopsora pachyrhizi]|uniref:Uncharacterized protein n=1 Tax=Phakopsora pachyrhizi TaxID=170000 RepID=A0AAV0B292_PHAPC|nr:hypothetical protein PPACK8108_LOCUS10782 [Phakopsora pachyrhizi]